MQILTLCYLASLEEKLPITLVVKFDSLNTVQLRDFTLTTNTPRITFESRILSPI